MKTKIFTFLLSACFVTMAMAAEKPNIIIKKASVAPEIDGLVDVVWAEASKQTFKTPFKTETPSLGEEGTTTWQALWTDDGIYLLLVVNDDEWYPSYVSGGNSWEYDKPEIYFDVNEIKVDGGGASGGKGHIQWAPAATAENIDGALGENNGASYAYKVSDPAYKVEYFFPFTKLIDAEGNPVDITRPIGFDVTLIDREVAGTQRHRLNWSNDGTEAYGGKADESWNSMDGCGTITLSDFDGGIIAKATVAPVLDGVVDAVWANATAYNIDKPFQKETPTLGESGTTTWQGLWNDEGIYILMKVNDDEFYPAYMNNEFSANWNYDKPEVYFDVNAEKKDGIGGSGGSNKGHYQFAPPFIESEIDGTIHEDGDGVMHAFKVANPTYVAEYFFPFSKLVDKDGVEVDKSMPIGFDVTIIDGESAAPGVRQRAVWTNVGAINESNSNMDDCGLVMLDGAVEATEVEKITVTGGSITTDNVTLQMVANVEPSDANQNVKWVVENGTGRATIDSKGVLTGIINGTVLVKAIAKDGTDVEGKTTVTISGQIVTLQDISIIKNGNFDQGTDGKKDWTVTGTVQDGWLVTECTPRTNEWDHKILQKVAIKDAEAKYIVKFKAYASVDMVTPLVQEDEANGWNKDMASTSAYRASNNWLIPVTTEPQWFEIDMIHLAWSESSIFNFNWQLGFNEGTLYVDSVVIYNEADLALVTSAKTLSNVNKVKLYPNPVQTELTISKIAVANSKVSVYNAVGQKLMEKTANGTQAKFDVANLRKGMYFVRFSDGTSEKFIKQ